MIIDAPYPPVDGTQPCRSEDPELFFPQTSRDATLSAPRIEQVCGSCPFRKPCLAYSLTHQVHGIWAGMGWRKRNQLRREHDITPIPMALSGGAR